MKHYYFMNKLEVVEKEDYENPEGYVRFYYDRDSYRSLRETSIQEDLCKQASSAKRRRHIYIFTGVLLVIMYLLYSHFGS